jgi:Tfp pilus assembly protein PilN
LPYLVLLSIGVATWQLAWLPGSARRAQLIAEKTRLQSELVAQEQLLGQRAAVLAQEPEWRKLRLELARRLPPLSYWPEMLAQVEELFFRPGIDVTSLRVAVPQPLPVAPATPGGAGAVPVPQQGDLLAAQGTATVTADSKESFFTLLAGLEALDFLAPVRTVSYTLAEGQVQARMEFQLLLSVE